MIDSPEKFVFTPEEFYVDDDNAVNTRISYAHGLDTALNVAHKEVLKVGWSTAFANGVLPVQIEGVEEGEIPIPMLMANTPLAMTEFDAAYAIISDVTESTDAGADLSGGRDASVSLRTWQSRWHRGIETLIPQLLPGLVLR